MLQIIYVSSALKPFTPDELAELLRQAREKNHRLGLTGLLLYHDGNFIQVLEGPDQAVRDMYARIERDDRHHSLITLSEQQVEQREFGEWEMGFKDISALAEQDFPGLSDYLRDPMAPGPTSRTRARVLLETFRKNMR